MKIPEPDSAIRVGSAVRTAYSWHAEDGPHGGPYISYTSRCLAYRESLRPSLPGPCWLLQRPRHPSSRPPFLRLWPSLSPVMRTDACVRSSYAESPCCDEPCHGQ